MLDRIKVEEFEKNGFTIQNELISNDEVSEFLADVESICAGNTLAQHDKTRLEMEPNQPPDGTRVRRLYEPCTHYPRFRAFAESTKLLDCIEALLGPNLMLHYSKLNMKPPAIGSVVEWHQDLACYPLTNRDSLAVLVYLDDADIGNGCLKVIPGMQNGPLMNYTTGGFFQGRITEPVDESLAVPVEGKAGTAIFMHCMTPHTSAPNKSDRPRRTLILSYRTADAVPLYMRETTVGIEANARLVRGQVPSRARFTMTEFPIPHYRWKFASLYELQELSRASDQKK
ncbi:MAG: phytanoyl-CoA dioxygenase family protein [Acidobacteria bacterium]|nr:MAG: phytanoyl-CoA dioxygenase family protein [Acidobacteriota bacterium]